MQSAIAPNAVIRFGIFEADLRSGELRKNGVRVKIQELPFRALKLLLSRPNQILSREEFRQTLWPGGVFVDFDHGISSAINRLREALGDSAGNPQFIETMDRRGYRWIPPTHSVELPAQVVARSDLPNTISPSLTLSRRWRWILVLSASVLAFAAWIFKVSDQLAKTGTTAQLRSSPLSSASPHHPANPEADDLYLKGRYYWNKRTPDGLNKAVDYFTQAIVRDPNYAQAYAGLADCYNLLREYTAMPDKEAYPRALAAAKRAVELDDNLAEAHASLGFISFYWSWDAAAAEHEFQRALELNPNDVSAHHWYATALSAAGREEEALAEIEQARRLDPTSTSVLADKGLLLFNAGQQEQAVALLKQMEATEPEFVSPHRYLADIYFVTNDYPRYLAEYRKTAQLVHDEQALEIAASAEKGFPENGGPGMLNALLKTQEKLYQEDRMSPYALADSYALLGKKQKALYYLQAAYDRHDGAFLSLAVDHALISLHNEPLYHALLARVGFRTIS
jgi:DNA-binding winged helix-turn-helix (wHTH) protein/Tfp pilus assembly protein PilF